MPFNFFFKLNAIALEDPEADSNYTRINYQFLRKRDLDSSSLIRRIVCKYFRKVKREDGCNRFDGITCSHCVGNRFIPYGWIEEGTKNRNFNPVWASGHLVFVAHAFFKSEYLIFSSSASLVWGECEAKRRKGKPDRRRYVTRMSRAHRQIFNKKRRKRKRSSHTQSAEDFLESWKRRAFARSLVLLAHLTKLVVNLQRTRKGRNGNRRTAPFSSQFPSPYPTTTTTPVA